MNIKNKTLLHQISDVAWLVQKGAKRVGILNKDIQENYTYITGKEIIKFDDEVEVTEHFGNINLFEEQITTPTKTDEEFFIKGYKVDYEQPFAVDETDSELSQDLPLYTKIEGSKVYYAAGYYCINFEKGWKHAHGPKLSTILKYGYEGPFKNEIDVRQRLKVLNKEAKVK